jgi:hypothetical protein
MTWLAAILLYSIVKLEYNLLITQLVLNIRYTILYISFIHREKKVREFPVPSRDVTTKLSLGGNNDVITEIFLPRESLVSDIPAGDGKLVNLFYGVWVQSCKGRQNPTLLDGLPS